jgi:hypothetical protein
VHAHGWFGRIAALIRARADHVAEAGQQREAALSPSTAGGVQATPVLSGLSHISGLLCHVLALLKARQAPVDPDAAALKSVTAAVQQRFAAQAADKDGFTALLHQAFGDAFDTAKAETLRQQALAGDFSWMPRVQVVDSATLVDTSGTQAAGHALGAYAASTDTIYLSRELLHTDPAQAQRTLMEEIGHGIDARINTHDAVGDEGELFSRLMHGDKLSATDLQALRTEDDHGTVQIGGQAVGVEYGWFKKAFKSITHAITNGIKNVAKAVVNGAINLVKSAITVTVGLATLDFNKVKQGLHAGVSAVVDTAKEIHKATKETIKAIHKATKEAFKSLMQSKLFAAVLMVCRFIPIPIVQLVVRIVDMVRAAYMIYQGIKNKSLGAVLGGVASVVGGAGNVAASLGASASTVATITSVANAASKLSMAYNAVANKDLGAAMGLLGGAISGPNASPQMTQLATVGGYVQQGLAIRTAVRSGDALGALGGALGLAGAATDEGSPTSNQLALAREAVTGLNAINQISKGHLDAAQSLAQGMTSAQDAARQADEVLARQRAALVNAPAEQAAPAAADATHEDALAVPPAEDTTHEPVVAEPPAPKTVRVGSGDTLIDIAHAQYGEHWKAGLTQLMLDNNLKVNQWGSPILREGRELVVGDISDKSQDEIDSLSRTGGRIVSGNAKGLQVKADLEERARAAAAEKVAEADTFSRGARQVHDPATSNFSPLLTPAEQQTDLPATFAAGVRAGAHGTYEPSYRDLSSTTLQRYLDNSPGNRLVDDAGRRLYNETTGAKAADVMARAIEGTMTFQEGAYEAATFRDAEALRIRGVSTSPEMLEQIARARGDKPTDALTDRMSDPALMREYVDGKRFNYAEDKLKKQGEMPTPEQVYREIIASSGRPDAKTNAAAVERAAMATRIQGVGQVVGRAALVVGVASDGYSLAKEVQSSARTGDYDNTYREGSRIAGGWTGAWVGGKAGAATGALAGGALGSFVPVLGNGVGAAAGGLIGGLMGGVGGYWAGSKLGTAGYDAAVHRP